MTERLYIEIPNWDGPDGFQHYKERDPIWIKCYTRLLSHDAYGDLSYHLRGILHSLWMEYARANRQLPGDTLTLTRRLGHRVLTRDLEALNRAGFIQFRASTPLAGCKQDASEMLALARSREAEAEAEAQPLEENPPSFQPNSTTPDDDIPPEPQPELRAIGDLEPIGQYARQIAEGGRT